MNKTILSCFLKSMLLAVCMLAVAHSPAEAKVFRWIDDMGMVHYSDYRSAIPVQYRDQIKDQVKPKKFLSSGDDDQQAKLATGKGEGLTASGEEAEKKEGEKKGEGTQEGGEEAGPMIDPEVAKLLVESRDYLAYENAVYRRWMRAAKFDKEEGRFFVMLVHQYLPRKEELIKKIEVTEQAKDFQVLGQIKFHLMDQVKEDKETKVGGQDYIQRLEALERRLKGALIEKDSFVETLDKELEKAKVGGKLIAKMQETIEKEEEAAKQTRPSSIKVEEVDPNKKNKVDPNKQNENTPQPPPPGM